MKMLEKLWLLLYQNSSKESERVPFKVDVAAKLVHDVVMVVVWRILFPDYPSSYHANASRTHAHVWMLAPSQGW